MDFVNLASTIMQEAMILPIHDAQMSFVNDVVKNNGNYNNNFVKNTLIDTSFLTISLKRLEEVKAELVKEKMFEIVDDLYRTDSFEAKKLINENKRLNNKEKTTQEDRDTIAKNKVELKTFGFANIKKIILAETASAEAMHTKMEKIFGTKGKRGSWVGQSSTMYIPESLFGATVKKPIKNITEVVHKKGAFNNLIKRFDEIKKSIKRDEKASKRFGWISTWYGPVDYVYSGVTHKQQDMPEEFATIARQLEKEFGHREGYFNSALMNIFPKGKGISKHADNESIYIRDTGTIGSVATISLGGTSEVSIIPNDGTESKVYTIKSGDLYVMPDGDFQVINKHAVGKATAPRISMTFRHIPESQLPKQDTTRFKSVQRFKKTLWTIADTRKNPNTIFIFGDNLLKRGKKGQAIIRDAVNAFGIPTKRKPATSLDSYFSDKTFEQNKIDINNAFLEIPQGKDIVLAKADLGAGLAQLQKRAPKTWDYLQGIIQHLEKTSNLPTYIVQDTTRTFQFVPNDPSLRKGSVEGDAKDAAMRKVADNFIGETSSKKSSSSTHTSAKSIAAKTGSKVKGSLVGYRIGTSGKFVFGATGGVTMLARNGALKGTALGSQTKQSIKTSADLGSTFVVGDMPNVDSQFIDYLDEIGAKYTIYHTGETSRINRITQKPKTTSTPKDTKLPQEIPVTVEWLSTGNKQKAKYVFGNGKYELTFEGYIEEKNLIDGYKVIVPPEFEDAFNASGIIKKDSSKISELENEIEILEDIKPNTIKAENLLNKQIQEKKDQLKLLNPSIKTKQESIIPDISTVQLLESGAAYEQGGVAKVYAVGHYSKSQWIEISKKLGVLPDVC
jgi:alkylated DNA repair dioxygenase AlkB